MITTRSLIALAAMLSAACGQGSFVYDQESATGPAGPGILYDIQPYEPFGQSFVPALTNVGFVQLELFDGLPRNGSGATVCVNLLSDSINSGQILGSTDGVFMPDSFQGVTNFFFPAPVSVNPGTPYYFQLVVASGDLWRANAGFSYPSGGLFLQGAYQPNISLWFREGVVVPEPSAVALGLVCCVVAAYRHSGGRVKRGSPDLGSGCVVTRRHRRIALATFARDHVTGSGPR